MKVGFWVIGQEKSNSKSTVHWVSIVIGREREMKRHISTLRWKTCLNANMKELLEIKVTGKIRYNQGLWKSWRDEIQNTDDWIDMRNILHYNGSKWEKRLSMESILQIWNPFYRFEFLTVGFCCFCEICSGIICWSWMWGEGGILVVGAALKIIIVKSKDEQSRRAKACQARLGPFENNDYEFLVLAP